MTIAQGQSHRRRQNGDDRDFVMKLFAVRTIEGQLSVGFFWVAGLADLRLAVGGVVIDPADCEYKPITNDWAAVVWPNEKSWRMGIGIFSSADDPRHELHAARVRRGISFEYGLEPFVTGVDVTGWKPLDPNGDYPLNVAKAMN
jgi:hypothetical protein